MSINLAVVDGVVKNPALRYSPDGKPEFRFTLVQQEGNWPLYLPCCAVGAAAERLASEIDADMHIVVTSGKLVYRKRANKSGGEASRWPRPAQRFAAGRGDGAGVPSLRRPRDER